MLPCTPTPHFSGFLLRVADLNTEENVKHGKLKIEVIDFEPLKLNIKWAESYPLSPKNKKCPICNPFCPKGKHFPLTS
jgi:hypothetical protein